MSSSERGLVEHGAGRDSDSDSVAAPVAESVDGQREDRGQPTVKPGHGKQMQMQPKKGGNGPTAAKCPLGPKSSTGRPSAGLAETGKVPSKESVPATRKWKMRSYASVSLH